MATAPRPDGFRGEFLWELEIATRQNIALAEAFPPEKYPWRPDPNARSVSEVFVHVSAGIFMLLDLLGVPAPSDVYGDVALTGRAAALPGPTHASADRGRSVVACGACHPGTSRVQLLVSRASEARCAAAFS